MRLPTALLSLLLVPLAGCAAAGKPWVELRGERFSVEIADDEAERNRGLMFRDQMAADAGMLFLYDAEQPLAFWMKNTRIPLDILYFDQDRLTARTETGLTGMTTQIDTILDVWAEHDTFIQVIPGVATTVTF